MGYSLSWLAVRGKATSTVREQLGFRETGEHEEFPESHLTAAELPHGWYLIVSNHSERVISDDALQQLSSDCEVTTCFVEEHVMFSYATGWKNGHRSWSVMHSAQNRRDHLETTGELPVDFDSILGQLRARQRDADVNNQNVDFIFDVPVELARSLVGYRHDQDIPGQAGKPFAVLAGGGLKAGAAHSWLERLNHKWMALAGWQRGILGVLIILTALFIMLCVITLIIMWLT